MEIKVNKIRGINTVTIVSVNDCKNGYIAEYSCVNSNCNAKTSRK